MPLDDLASYRSAKTEAAAPPPRASDGAGLSADAGAPPGAASAEEEPAASLDAGALPVPDESVTPESDRSPASPASGGSEPDAGIVIVPSPDTLVGQSRQTLEVAGLQRAFIYYAPADLDASLPVPVLFVAHGSQETADEMVAITGYDAIADREGFVVLYPEGQGAIPWNIGSEVCPIGSAVASASGDDSAFIDAMLGFVAAERSIDREHVFMVGLGGGAYLAHDVACRRSDIRAIAAHSGGSHALQGCAAAPKPVLVLHGTDDSVVPRSCGAEARDRWVEHNGCASDVDPLEVRGGLCDISRDCPVDGEVALCAFVGMGRGWAGGAGQAASYLDFASASELSWRFFELYAW